MPSRVITNAAKSQWALARARRDCARFDQVETGDVLRRTPGAKHETDKHMSCNWHAPHCAGCGCRRRREWQAHRTFALRVLSYRDAESASVCGRSPEF